MIGAQGLRVAAVVAHPDDEAWAIGGLLATMADAGADVTVICATAGEGGGDPVVRRDELRRSCAALGVREPVVLGWPDGGVSALDRDAAVADLVRKLEALAPHIVVGLGPDGGYGHTDHTALCHLLRAAIHRLPALPCLLEAKFTPGALAKVQRFMCRHAPQLLDPAIDALGGQAHPDDVVVPLGPFAAHKRDAIAAHRSQRPREDVASFLGGAAAALMDQERYTIVAGARPVALHLTRDLAPRVNGGISVLARAVIRADGPLACRVISFDAWRPRRADPPPPAPTPTIEENSPVLRLTHPEHLGLAAPFAAQPTAPATVVVHHAMLWMARDQLGVAHLPTTFVQHVDQAAIDAARAVKVPTASAAAEGIALREADLVVVARDAAKHANSGFLRLDRVVGQPRDGPFESGELSTAPIVLFAGRWSDAKGADTFFAALPIVARARPEVRFVLAGGIPDTPKSERRWWRRWSSTWSPELAARVSALGWVTRARMRDLYKECAVLAVPSRAETLGLVALEGRAAGARIVASGIGSLRATLSGYDAVTFVPVADPVALAEAILAALPPRRE